MAKGNAHLYKRHMETNVTSSAMFSSPKAKCAVHARAVNDTQSQIFQEKKTVAGASTVLARKRKEIL